MTIYMNMSSIGVIEIKLNGVEPTKQRTSKKPRSGLHRTEQTYSAVLELR